MSVQTLYTANDLTADVLLDASGQGSGYTMVWEEQPLSNWSMDLDKDGYDAVAFIQEGSDFRYIVYGDLNDDHTHIEYLNGEEVDRFSIEDEVTEVMENIFGASNIQGLTASETTTGETDRIDFHYDAATFGGQTEGPADRYIEFTSGVYSNSNIPGVTQTEIDALNAWIAQQDPESGGAGGGSNSAPVANDDSYSIDEGSSIQMTNLANDSDAEDGSLQSSSITIVTGFSHGTLQSGLYTPDAGFVGTDTMTYTVADSEGLVSNEATVTVEVTAFDPEQSYAQEAVAGFFAHAGLTEIQNLQVSVVFDEQSDTDTFTITADSYTYNGTVDSGGIDVGLTFSDGVLTSSTGLPDPGVIPGLDEASIQQWYEFSDPDKNDEYVRDAVEKLFTQADIHEWNNLNASMAPTASGDQFIVEADSITVNGSVHHAVRIELEFENGSLTSATGIPSGISGTLNNTYLQTWYDYSGPEQQRQEDQQDQGYYEGEEEHTSTYNNVWTWTDHEGILWTVVDKEENGVWSSTETSSGGDVRTHSSSWDPDTQTGSWTENFHNADSSVDYTRVETQNPDGTSSVRLTGKTDHLLWMPLDGIYTDVDITETRDAFWNTTNVSGTVTSPTNGALAVTFEDSEILIGGESLFQRGGFDDHFQDRNEWEWTDDWSGITWKVVEEPDVDGNWVMTETAWRDGVETGEVRSNYSTWDDETSTSTWTEQFRNQDGSIDYTRTETYESDGSSSETITGSHDHIAWYYLSEIYDDINVTVTRDTNWNTTSITGSLTKDGQTVTVSFDDGQILIDGESIDERDEKEDHFQEGVSSEWSWTDWEGVTWTVTDQQDGNTWTSTEEGSNGDRRVHSNEWDEATNSSIMTEEFRSGDNLVEYTRQEVWREDGTSTETVTGKTDQIGWMLLDGVYTDVNVTITRDWETMQVTGSAVNMDGQSVTVGYEPHSGELTIDGSVVDLSQRNDIDLHQQESWESSWEWTEQINGGEVVWVVTDSQEGDTWKSTEIAYREDGQGGRTPTGDERIHSSVWNERTQTNIWTDSEKSVDEHGNTVRDFTRVETQRADGSSTEKITGKVDKFGGYDSVDVTIERDSGWNITSVNGTADGAVVAFDGTNITIAGSVVSEVGDGAHANQESWESSWTWTDWEGTTWTVTDKQEGDTWTSTEVGSNGDIRVHKNSWSGTTETWSESYTSGEKDVNGDPVIEMTRVEVRNADGSSKVTITGKDDGFEWWDFDTPYTGLDLTIERDANWNITSLSGSADGDVTFGFDTATMQLTIDGVAYSGFDERSHMVQENWTNTWEWTDWEGVTWTVTDKQDGDTWISTEEGSNGDVRINTSTWDDDADDYVNITSFKSGTSDLDYSIREIWNDDGSSSEIIKGTTDQIGWFDLGETFSDVEVTIERDSNWNTLSVSGSGRDASGTEASFGWLDDQLTFNSNPVDPWAAGGAAGTAQQSWESTWEWTDWEGVTWTVTDKQEGDTWTSTEVGSNGDTRTSESRWDPVKQISIWTETFDSGSTELEFKRVEVFNPNGTSSETITGTTDHVSWWPLHQLYTDVDVTIERDADWNVYSVTGSGTSPDGTVANFGWDQNGQQITFDGNMVEDPTAHHMEVDNYWENSYTWTDEGRGVTWEVVEVQDGNTWTRSETAYSDEALTTTTGEIRTETNTWNHETGTSTWSRHEVDPARGIDFTMTETGRWDEATQSNVWSETVTGRTDHIHWVALGDVQDVDLTISYDDYHNITDISGSVGTSVVTYVDGQILVDGSPFVMTWTDWDGTVWEVQESQDGDTHTRTEIAYDNYVGAGDSGNTTTGATRVETHSWDQDTQTNRMTEKVTDASGATVIDVEKVESHTPGEGSSTTITGTTDHIEWMNLGEIYHDVNITVERDDNWNIKEVTGSGTDESGNTRYFGFSGADNQLMIGDDAASLALVAEDVGQSWTNTWTWDDHEGVTWTVTDEQKGDTWVSTEVGSNGATRTHESTWDQDTRTNTWSEHFVSADGAIDFTRTEVYDENSQASTMTTTGSSDHIGWMYMGEVYTNINVTETRDQNWNTASITGSATNSAGEVVTIGWEDGELTVDGDALTIHGPGDFSKSADNFENEWSYYDDRGVEWTVTESQQGDAWVSEERSEDGDFRLNKSFWDQEDQESKHVTKFKSADGDIKYKMVEVFKSDGVSVLKYTGDSDHIGWDYLGDIYTDIDVKIVRDANWNILKVAGVDTPSGVGPGDEGFIVASAKNPDGATVSITKGADNQILIDGVDIHHLGDEFFQGMDTDHFDEMESGSWEFDYQNPQGENIHVVEEGIATDIVTIKTDEYDIALVFDVDAPTVDSLISVKGVPSGLAAFEESTLEAWYSTAVVAPMDETGHMSSEEEVAFVHNKVETYLADNGVSITGLDVGFDIADTWSTTETNQTTGEITVRSRTEQLDKEIEREESYANQAAYDSGNPSWWSEAERSFEDDEYGFNMVEVTRSSSGEEMNVVVTFQPDGTAVMNATGTAYLEQLDVLVENVSVTSQMDGWKFVDFQGTGTISSGEHAGKTAVITSDGTDPYGGPLVHLTINNGDGTFTEILGYDEADAKQAHLADSGNPLDRHVLEDGEGYVTSGQGWVWEQTSYQVDNGNTVFEGLRVRDGKPDQTIRVEESLTYEGPMVVGITHHVTTSRGEDYTATFSLNHRFDVEIDVEGTKHFRGELYSDVDLFKEITPNGEVRIEGAGRKLDGTEVEFFKGHGDTKLDIVSIDRDGNIRKISEEEDGDDAVIDLPVNEIFQWSFVDHEGVEWTVIEKFDGNTSKRSETNTTGDQRTFEDTWDSEGGFTSIMTEALVGEPVFTETRSSTPEYSEGTYREVMTVVTTRDGNEVENFTETITFNADYSATVTIAGTVDYMGVLYTNVDVTIMQDANWSATSVSGTATRASDSKAVEISMDGTHPWGEPKLVLTIAGGETVTDDRTVVDNKSTDNTDPTVVDDTATTSENQSVIVDVLDNDSDSDQDTLSIKSVGEASRGEVFLANGEVIYTPEYGYSGSDSFSYTVTDGRGGSGKGKVTITIDGVNSAPVAVNDSFTVLQGSGSAALDVLANDSDEDGDDLSITAITPIPTTAGGWVNIFGDIVTYELPSVEFVGDDSFTYYISDGGSYAPADKPNANVTITVEALNNAPVAVADTVTLDEDEEAIQIRVLSNDSDADGDDLSIDSVTNPDHGTVRLMAGSIFYTPDENYNGSDSFDYTVVDPSGASATETVTLTINPVNDAPVAVTDILNVEEGSEGITVDVLSNDYDREGDTFTLTSVGEALHGTVVKTADGMVTYTPGTNTDGTNYTGADEFTYVTTDSEGAQSTGTVSITVSELNDAPVAAADTKTVAEDSSSNKVAVLDNDSDPEDDTLTLDSVSTPEHGTATLSGNFVLYTPDANYSGTDTFTYKVSDGNGNLSSETVTVTVTGSNDAPTAVDDALGTVSSAKPVKLDLLSNDYDVDSGDTISIVSVGDADSNGVGDPANGKVTLSGGTVRYVANRGSSGKTDSFEYTIEDESGEQSTATATFTLSTNTNPIATNDAITVLEDADAAELGILDNDTDSDSDKVQVLKVGTDPSHGTATVTNGKLFYQPDANYNGSDSFTYVVKDGNGGRDEATVTITVTAVNDAPTAVNDTATVDADSGATTISVLGNDSDLDGDSVIVSSTTQPLHGSSVVLADGSGVTYAPDAGYSGSDSFTYKVSDGTTTSTATVNITVRAGNTVPTATDDAPTVVEDSKNNQIDVLGNDSDADGDDLSVVSVTQGEHGSVQLTGGSVFYTPDANYSGSDNFTYTVKDGNGGVTSGKVTVSVTAVEDSPTATNDTLDAMEAGAAKVKVDLISNDSDPDGDAITITDVGSAQYGTVSFAGGVVYYQPGSTADVTDSFSYTIEDSNGNASTGYVKVDIVQPNNGPTGSATITGGAQPYQTLTVSNTLADADGISGEFSYQWYKDGAAMPGQTGTTYKVALEDVGSAFTVAVSYTDDRGTAESVTTAATGTVTALDEPFSFVAGDVGADGLLTLTLQADVEAIYSRSDITGITAADLGLNIDWTKFAPLDGGESGAKYEMTTVANNLIALSSSSTSDSDTFDQLTLASTRTSGPLLTLVDTDATNDSSTGIGTTADLVTLQLKPVDPAEKIAVTLSGTVVANQGQVNFAQYDATTTNITGVATNSTPEGAVAVSGVVAVDEVLTASHSITDADGMGVVSYQWYRDGDAINGASNDTYTVVTADINKSLTVKGSYTDGAGNAESVQSGGYTVTQSTVNKPFMFTSELITAADASTALYGTDLSSNPTETILKLTLEGDITRFDTDNSSDYTAIAGAELDISMDWTQFESISISGSAETFELDNVYTGQLFMGTVTNESNEFSKIVLASLNTSNKPILTLVDSVETTGRGYTDLPSSEDFATIYLNPKDTVRDVEITFGGAVSVNQGDDTFTQLSHSLEVQVKDYDATITTPTIQTTNGGMLLDNLSINLWDNGSDTGNSLEVVSGQISIDNTMAFDEVKLSATDAYDSNINISDAIDVLRDIVNLENFTAGSANAHAADVNNDGNINISDAIDILRHIVNLEAIDTFDLVDDQGNRVTQMDAGSSGTPPEWTIVANGDVNLSGGFAEDYVVPPEVL